MVYLAAFGILQLIVTIYAFRFGGWPERLVGGAMVLALVAGWLLPFHPKLSYRTVEVWRMVVDTTLWGVVSVVALAADRFWPIWMAAVALLAIGIHGIRAYDQSLLPIAYYQLIDWLAYPMLAILVIGTRRHSRRSRR